MMTLCITPRIMAHIMTLKIMILGIMTLSIMT
jgi:hypothetical protein